MCISLFFIFIVLPCCLMHIAHIKLRTKKFFVWFCSQRTRFDEANEKINGKKNVYRKQGQNTDAFLHKLEGTKKLKRNKFFSFIFFYIHPNPSFGCCFSLSCCLVSFICYGIWLVHIRICVANRKIPGNFQNVFICMNLKLLWARIMFRKL